MYRQYKALPEFNRVCIKASRERAYQQHMDALKRMKPSVDTRAPVVPQTIGRNYKRYENEMQRNAVISRDNTRLLSKIDSYQRQEHYPRATPQRPFTLQGQAQRDEMWRITHENHKLLTAVQERRPILNRNDWLRHKLDHEYQITKMSEFKRTVPMSEILRQEMGTSLKSRPHTTFGSVTSNSRRSQSVSDAGSRVDLEEENDKRADALLPDNNKGNSSNKGNKVNLGEETNKRTNALMPSGGSSPTKKSPQSSKSTSGAASPPPEKLDDVIGEALEKKDSSPPEEEEKPAEENTGQNAENDGVLEGQSNAITGALLGDL